MRWPWQREPVEKRESYTDALVQVILAARGDSSQAPSETAAAELAAAQLGRALASGTLRPDAMLLGLVTPAVLATIGRELILNGECAFLIDGGGLLPAAAWDVHGGPDPRSWRYRLDLAGPSAWSTVYESSARVLHFRYQSSAVRPWAGIGPLTGAGLTARLLAGLESQLADEAAAGSGYLLPVPEFDQPEDEEAEDPAITQLKADLAGLKGRTSLVETTAAGWGEGRVGAPQSDWQSKRIGSNPPATVVQLRENAAIYLLAACGYPPALLAPGDGAGQREAWRRFLFGFVAPVGKIVAAELALKLNVSGVKFTWDELGAADIASRSRGFQSLVHSGMSMEKAAALTGLLGGE